MRTPEQRGRYGRWLVAAREARGWDTAQKARDALAAAGIRIGTSAYAEYESGSKVPSRNHLPKLVEFWGPVPDDDAARDSDLVAAINAQTAAITALVEELRLSRGSQVKATEVAFQALGALGAAQGRSGTPDGSEPQARAGTGR